MRRIDIVVPAYNEEACLERFHTELSAVLDRLPHRFRVIYVDDGSADATPEICRALKARDDRVEYIRLSRNFGHQAALTAGLDAADADAVITMDADLQHPPSVIPSFVEAWEQGAELVTGIRTEADSVGVRKRVPSQLFYRLLNAVSEIPITRDAPDFRLLDHRVVSAVRQLREQSRFLRGIYSWIGFRQRSVQYCQASRAAGETKYTPAKTYRLALAAVLSFSRAPLRLATLLGVVVSALTFCYGLYAVAQAVVFRRALPGWTSLAVLVSFLSGIQLLTLGLFGEYLGQVLEETKGRPLYVVADSSLAAGEGSAPTSAPPRRGEAAGRASPR